MTVERLLGRRILVSQGTRDELWGYGALESNAFLPNYPGNFLTLTALRDASLILDVNSECGSVTQETRRQHRPQTFIRSGVTYFERH